MSDTKKTVLFTGKQVLDSFTDKKKRVRRGVKGDEPSRDDQLSMLSERSQEITSLVQTKVNGYKQQDIRRELFDQELLISTEETLSKLEESKLTCHYCANEVKIVYHKVRDPKQWSLDRIDNDKCHSDENTVIACLYCNLKRRRMKSEVFKMGVNMVVKKKDTGSESTSGSEPSKS
jgi:hypothetical protein